MSITKRYLCCVALALCVSGSAYASKNPASRGLMQKVKAGVIESKLGRSVLAGIAGGIIICSIPGCGNGTNPVTPTETETVQVTEVTETVQVVTHYDGDSIYFELDGTIYEGHVVEGVSADEVLVSVSDGSDMIINVNDIGGTVIADHPDLGVKVKLLGDRNKGERTLDGKIVDVYDDGVRKIEIFNVNFMDGGREFLDVPRIRFVDEDKDFEGGGFLTLEEFADRFMN